MNTNIDTNMLDTYPIEELLTLLKSADQAYFNNEETAVIISDALYDTIKFFCRHKDPHNPYFKTIGATPIVGSEMVKLPCPMGSLDQEYTQDDLNNWFNQNHADSYVLTSKLDGISLLLVYRSGELVAGYTRGDGYNGLDITRHLAHMYIPRSINLPGEVLIRAEAIIPVEVFNNNHKTQYKTPRSAVSGVMKSHTSNKDVLANISIIAYEIMNNHTLDKIDVLNCLMGLGFDVPRYLVISNQFINVNTLEKWIENDNDTYKYEVDGVVIEINNYKIREQVTQEHNDSINPGYARKFKILNESQVKEVTVLEVVLQISKTNYIKPRVVIEPVELYGTTVTFFNGFNAAYVNENKIGPGSVLRVTKAGTVIPYILNAVSPSTVENYDQWFQETFDEFGEWHWSENHVDAILNESSSDSIIRQMVSFFDSVNAPQLGIGNCTKLYNAGFISVLMIIGATRAELCRVIGENGNLIFDGLIQAFENITTPKLMGASGVFGRGIGVRKATALCKHLGTDVGKFTIQAILSVEGFRIKTASKVVAGIEDWKNFKEQFLLFHAINDQQQLGTKWAGKHIVFTGFRNAEWEEVITSEGGTIQSSVSTKTDFVVCKDPNQKTGKLDKARQLHVRIISVSEFEQML